MEMEKELYKGRWQGSPNKKMRLIQLGLPEVYNVKLQRLIERAVRFSLV